MTWLRPYCKLDKERSMDDRWMSVDEIAAYLGVSKDTVHTWANERAFCTSRSV